MFDANWFFDLEYRLIDSGLDSDEKSFAEIKSDLQNPKKLNASAFARAVIYVILAGGFSQKTAKKKHNEIILFLETSDKKQVISDDLLKIFNNKNKINAIIKVWENRERYRDEYYEIDINENHKSEIINQKLRWLARLPHIGKITANHLARNLGENVVKYDIWIQRLGVAFADKFAICKVQSAMIDNGKIGVEIKNACDLMFDHLESETDLPRGYIDVVLWKALQTGLIKL